MTKVVFNACYGGFGLSKEAVQRYWEIKGQQVWIEDNDFGIFTVWLTPPEKRVKNEDWNSMRHDERIAYNMAYSEQTWCDRYVDRHDPVLVQVVEELGEKASGRYSKLVIDEVNGTYRITEYDGYECVETPDSLDWITP